MADSAVYLHGISDELMKQLQIIRENARGRKLLAILKALSDVPSQAGFPFDVTYPTKP